MKDLRKEDNWCPGWVAERSGSRTYVVVVNEGKVWKRHVDHVRRDSMDRAVQQMYLVKWSQTKGRHRRKSQP